MNWQRANVQTAAGYIRDLMTSGVNDVKTRAVYEGLLDVLDPTRRVARVQRESAQSVKAAVVVQTARERRNRSERRRPHDRRTSNGAPPAGIERRKDSERRSKHRRD